MSARLMFHVQHLLGIGHLRRAATLSRHFAAAGIDFAAGIRARNPHVKWNDPINHGFLVLTLTPTQAAAEFFTVSSVLAKQYEVTREAAFTVAAGRRRTKATGTSPCSGCGRPMTPASTTSGCSCSAFSTCCGEIFSPSQVMTCLMRPRNQK